MMMRLEERVLQTEKTIDDSLPMEGKTQRGGKESWYMRGKKQLDFPSFGEG